MGKGTPLRGTQLHLWLDGGEPTLRVGDLVEVQNDIFHPRSLNGAFGRVTGITPWGVVGV